MWQDYYNYHRPHGTLEGQTPYERLLSKTSARVSTTSLGYFDDETCRLEPIDNPFGPKLLPVCSE